MQAMRLLYALLKARYFLYKVSLSTATTTQTTLNAILPQYNACDLCIDTLW